MFKLIITLLLATAALFSGRAYCQETQTISGKVTKADVEGGVVYVKSSSGTHKYYVVTESDMYLTDHHMSILEIEIKDPVTIIFKNDSTGRNIIIKMVDTRE